MNPEEQIAHYQRQSAVAAAKLNKRVQGFARILMMSMIFGVFALGALVIICVYLLLKALIGA
jgi:hypothetical protein